MKKWHLAVPFISVVVLALFTPSGGYTATLSPVAATLDDTGVTTRSTDFGPALSVDVTMPSAGAALVIASFSAAGAKDYRGEWRLLQGSDTTLAIRRYLSGSSDKGIGSVVGIFENLAAGSNAVVLQHRSLTADQAVTTSGANLVVIPLVTTSGATLNHASAAAATMTSVSSTAFTDIGLSTSVDLALTTGNSLYVAMAMSSLSGGTAVTGTRQLQYRLSGSGTWTDTGNIAQRYLSGESDTGATMLYSVIDGLAQGTYDVRVVAKSSASGDTVQSINGTLAAVALSYATEYETGYFPTFSASALSAGGLTTTAFTTVPGATASVTLAATGTVFAAMSFGGTVAKGANQTAAYRLSLTDSSAQVMTSQANERFYSSSSDIGSGGAVALFSNVNTGLATVNGEHDAVSGGTLTTNITLSGFLMDSEYEATPVVLLQFGAVTLDGNVTVRWSTSSETLTAGFDVYRQDNGEWVKLNDALIPALGWPNGGVGASYSVADPGATADGTYTYKLVERTIHGQSIDYGPYERTVSEFMLKNVNVTSAGVALRWLSRSGERYRVLKCAGKLGGRYETIAEHIDATPPQNEYLDPAVSGGAFYRIELQP